MTSVERILQYANLEQEAPEHIKSKALPPDWPSRGDVTFDHMTLTYGGGGIPALKDLTMSIKAAEKVP